MVVDSYLDTSFLLKFYLVEPDSDEAAMCLRECDGVVWLSPLSDVEIITVLSRDPSSLVTERELSNYRDDLKRGVYRKLDIDSSVFASANEIAKAHTRLFGLRSLDILHLATALHYGIVSLGTYDDRLATAALALGLKVLPGRS